MDKKDLDENEEKEQEKDSNGKEADITHENKPPKMPMLVKEPSAAKYTVERVYTYEDYLNWPEDERVELIDGKIYYMAAPSKTHQMLLARLSAKFGNYLHGRSCDFYFAPFDVRLDLKAKKDTVVQPDLIVVCDDELLTEKGVVGSPDLVIEILSRSTASHDRVTKYNKYLEVGVKEYWLVDPNLKEVVVNILSSNRYMPKTYKKGDTIKASVLDDLYVNVTDLFEGYKGKEIEEVEKAREEEQKRADIRVKEEREKANDEKAELLNANAKLLERIKQLESKETT